MCKITIIHNMTAEYFAIRLNQGCHWNGFSSIRGAIPISISGKLIETELKSMFSANTNLSPIKRNNSAY